MKPSLPIIAVSVVFVGTIAVLGVAIERQRAPASPDFAGPPVAVKAGAATLCVGRQFVDPDALRAMLDGAASGRTDLAAFSADLTGLTPQRYAAGAYPSSPDWVRITLWPQDPPATGVDLEPACGAARCVMRTRLQPDGLRFDYSFPNALMPEWPRLHASVQKRVGEWAQDSSCRR